MIADNLGVHDLNALVRTCRATCELLSLYMYRRAVHLSSRSGGPYFLRAVNNGILTAITRFIEVGASVEMRDTRAKMCPTPLHICAYNGDIETAGLLIKNGANLSAVNFNHKTPLELMHNKYPIEVLLELVLDSGAESIPTLKCGGVLRMVAEYGSASMVELLLERGAVASDTDTSGVTPLHGAARNGSAETVRLLLGAGADIEATDYEDFAPLHRAVSCSNTEVVEVLLHCGANVEARDFAGCTPLFEAVRYYRETRSVAHRILHATPPPDGGFWNGTEGCVEPCPFTHQSEPIVDLLLDAGANVLAANNNGTRPLDLVVRSFLTWSQN
jgi:hypothetical protein